MFSEISTYDIKTDKQEEAEALMKEIVRYYKEQPGVVEVRFVKRTFKQKDFSALRAGTPSEPLKRYQGKVSYFFCFYTEDEKTHTWVSKLGMERFYDRLSSCLQSSPKVMLGETIG